jgi:beta-glucosidase/6-phospho-beta-glucosidase/beta-galactosidase
MYEADFVSSENGVVCPRENELSREEAVKDDFRIDYLSSYADPKQSAAYMKKYFQERIQAA